MIPFPPNANPVDPVYASGWNQLLDAARRSVPRAGPGITTQETPQGVIVSANGRRELELAAVITAVYGADGDPVERVTYDAVAVGLPDVVMRGVAPRAGRIYRDTVACYPCQVDDPCYIIRRPTRDGRGYTTILAVITEQYGVRRCQSGPGVQLRTPQIPPMFDLNGRVITVPPPPGGGGSATASGGGGGSSTGGGGIGES